MDEFKKDTGLPEHEPSVENEKEPTLENPKITSRLSDLDSKLPQLLEPIVDTIPNRRRGGHCIILYLPAIRDPIQIWSQTLITIGRKDKHLNLDPTVDLSDHNASLLGVSRMHVEISYENSNYYVIDKGSKNGTWVNKTKVSSIKKSLLSNHDTLRLGHFMIHVSTYQS